jgi:hypothetical protein
VDVNRHLIQTSKTESAAQDLQRGWALRNTHFRNHGDIDQRHSARPLKPDIPDGTIQPLEASLGLLLLVHHASCQWVVPIDRSLHALPAVPGPET